MAGLAGGSAELHAVFSAVLRMVALVGRGGCFTFARVGCVGNTVCCWRDGRVLGPRRLEASIGAVAQG